MEKRRALSPDVREFIYERDGGRCYYCEQPVSPFRCQVDHIQPLSRGGSSEIENLALACTECNVRKAARTPEEWAEALRLRAWEAVEDAFEHFHRLPGFTIEEPTHKKIIMDLRRAQDAVRDLDLVFPGELNRHFIARRREAAAAAMEGSDGSDTVH